MATIADMIPDDELTLWAADTAVWTAPDGYPWLDPAADTTTAADDTHPMPVARRGDGRWAWPDGPDGTRLGTRIRGVAPPGTIGIPDGPEEP